MSGTAATPPRERVALGLLASLGAVIGGVLLTVLIYRAGFIAGITSFAIAYGAAYLYTRGAGTPARRGLVPLIAIIVLGVVLSFFATVASDLVDEQRAISTASGADLSVVSYVKDNAFSPDVLSAYVKEIVFFAVFAVLGLYGTIRRLVSAR